MGIMPQQKGAIMTKHFTVVEGEIELVKTMLHACDKCDFIVSGSKFENELVFESTICESISQFGEMLEKRLIELQAELNS